MLASELFPGQPISNPDAALPALTVVIGDLGAAPWRVFDKFAPLAPENAGRYSFLPPGAEARADPYPWALLEAMPGASTPARAAFLRLMGVMAGHLDPYMGRATDGWKIPTMKNRTAAILRALHDPGTPDVIFIAEGAIRSPAWLSLALLAEVEIALTARPDLRVIIAESSGYAAGFVDSSAAFVYAAQIVDDEPGAPLVRRLSQAPQLEAPTPGEALASGYWTFTGEPMTEAGEGWVDEWPEWSGGAL